jgi:hypothetical protein
MPCTSLLSQTEDERPRTRTRTFVSLEQEMKLVKDLPADWQEWPYSLYARCWEPNQIIESKLIIASSVLRVLECMSRNCGALLNTPTDRLLPAAAFVHRGLEAHFTSLLVSDSGI